MSRPLSGARGDREDTLGAVGMPSSPHPPAQGRTPPPPGFDPPSSPRGGAGTDTSLSVHFDTGLSFRSSTSTGATSAPPPSGLDFELTRDQSRGAEFAQNPVGGERAFGAGRGRGGALLRPTELLSTASAIGRSESAPLGPDELLLRQASRSTSFANLAAALGDDLAESMEDSLQKLQQQQQHMRMHSGLMPSGAAQVQVSTTGLSSLQAPKFRLGEEARGSNRGDAIGNFERQSRHMASRLRPAGKRAELRYSSGADTEIIPSRMISSRGVPHHSQKQQERTLIPPRDPRVAASTPIPINRREGSHQVGVTVYEPESGANSPHIQPRGAAKLPATGQGKYIVVSSDYGGRASAPPKMYMKNPSPAVGFAHARGGTVRIHHALAVESPSTATPGTPGTGTPTFEDVWNQGSKSSPGRPNSPERAIDFALMAQAKAELAPFLWDPIDPSSGNGKGSPAPNKTGRGLAILHAAHLFIPDVRSTCEAYGALMSFRPEFSKSRGVIFVSYYDLRSAQYAAVEIRASLKRLAIPRGTTMDQFHDIQVQHCVSLNDSSANDESMFILSNLPGNMDESNLNDIMISYGAVRSVRYNGLGENDTGNAHSHVVEFYDVQDAKQALQEIECTPPWGTGVTVSVGVRDQSSRNQGQELMALISRWRKEESKTVVVGTTVNVGGAPTPSPMPSTETAKSSPNSMQSSSHSPSKPYGTSSMVSDSTGGYSYQLNTQYETHATPQLMLGPDGQYSYVVVNEPTHGVPPPPHGYGHPGSVYEYVPPYPTLQQQIVHGPHGNYVTTIPTQVYHHSHLPPSMAPVYPHHPPGAVSSAPYGYPPAHSLPAYTHVHGMAADSSLSTNSSGQHTHGERSGSRMTNESAPSHGGGGGGGGGGGEDGHQQLQLNIEAVETGSETRTSLMVRNIPNKYTQMMLLNDFSEAGHGPDKIDFFYLPIDFKNKCNRGYAFVNFVDFRDIIPFYHHYNGQNWKVFNSDKICDITYARIQGKVAMLKRFQNSALMEKDEDYRPVVFVSHGPKKGEREAWKLHGQATRNSP